MPPKVSRLLFLTVTTVFCANALAQQSVSESPTPNAAVASPLTTNIAPVTPIGQDRLVKVRGMIAARQLSAAVFELEKIKKETSDETLQSVARIMLVSVYLEQPNYERAKDLLEETFKRNKNSKNALGNGYLPVASQFIRGAENQLERYKRLGFNLSDPKLPAEAAADLDRWRKMLETIVEQTKEMSADEKKGAESLAVLEEAANARANLARDNYEAATWRHIMDDTREMIANAQTKVTDVDGTTVDLKNVAESKPPAPNRTATLATDSNQINASTKTISTPEAVSQVVNQSNDYAPKNTLSNVGNTIAQLATDKQILSDNRPLITSQETNSARTVNIGEPDLKVADSSLVKMDSLVDLATRKFPPTYPPTARTARVAGVVKVEVVVDEEGSVTEVKTSEGPELLRRAAAEAVKRWKFKPATRDGQPVRMSGFVNFNFTL